MSRIVFERHAHDLPDPGWFARGSLAECDCGAMFTGGNPGNPAYASWRRILRSQVVEAMAQASGPWIDVDPAVEEYHLARHHNALRAAEAALDAALDLLDSGYETWVEDIWAEDLLIALRDSGKGDS